MITCNRGRILAIVATLALAAACADYAHTNPFDPVTPVTLRIDGPDSVDLAVGDTLRLTLTSDPVFPHEPPVWRQPEGSFAVFHPTQRSGEFVLQHDWRGDTNTVIVEFRAELNAERSATKSIALKRGIAGMSVEYCFGNTVALVRVGAILDVCPRFVDRVRKPYQAIPTLATVTVRNPAVLEQTTGAAFRFSMLAPGSSYIVFTARGYRDSVRAIASTFP